MSLTIRFKRYGHLIIHYYNRFSKLQVVRKRFHEKNFTFFMEVVETEFLPYLSDICTCFIGVERGSHQFPAFFRDFTGFRII